MTCWFRDNIVVTHCLYRADGQPDRAHLIPKQRVARAGIADVWDERLIVPACRRHHHLFDGKSIRLAESDYPPELREWADEHGFYFADERSGWRKRFISEWVK